MASQPIARLTEQDYLALERAAEFKSEFVDGKMYPRSDVTSRHSILTVHLGVVLMNQLQTLKYVVYNSDLRVRAAKSQSYVYPDLSVAANEDVSLDADILETPTVIVEVLSPSTSDYDHGKKFAIYREIPSLKDYLLVHTQEIMIEHFTPQTDGRWLLAYHKGMDAVVELKSIGCTIALKDIYSGVFPENTDI